MDGSDNDSNSDSSTSPDASFGGFTASDFGFSPSDVNPSFGVPGALGGVAEAAAPGQTAPDAIGNPGLSLSAQYGEYGAGRAIAEKAAASIPGTPAPAESSIAGGWTFGNFTTGLLGLLGIASGTPAGVIGGGKSLSGLIGSSSLYAGPNDLGYASRSTGFGSPAPSLGPTGGNGSNGFATGSTVLGYAGTPVNRATVATPAGSGIGSLLAPLSSLFTPGTTQASLGRSGPGGYIPFSTTPTPQASNQSGIVPAVLIALGILALTTG